MSLPKNVVPSKSNCKIDDDTTQTFPRYRRLTAPGRSAIAVIELRGEGATKIVAGCFAPATSHAYVAGQIRYGVWTGGSHRANTTADGSMPVDSPDVSNANSGQSTTAESLHGESIVLTPCENEHFEIHCHGGPAAVARIEDDLACWGAISSNAPTPADGNTESRLIEEAEELLSRCLTARIASLALHQVRGALRDWAIRWRDCLSETNQDAFKRDAEDLLRTTKLGVRLAEPWKVVLLGPPNVGKSSLLNAIVGYDRSITLDVAGTTRDVLHADTVIEGLPLRFSDTAGIRDAREPIEREGIARAKTAASEADLLLLISEPLGDGRLPQLEKTDRESPRETHTLRVLNKRDQASEGESFDRSGSPLGIQPFDVATNALNRDGIGVLMSLIAAKLSVQLPGSARPLLINQRQTGLVRKMNLAATINQQTDLLDQLLGNPRE